MEKLRPKPRPRCRSSTRPPTRAACSLPPGGCLPASRAHRMRGSGPGGPGGQITGLGGSRRMALRLPPSASRLTPPHPREHRCQHPQFGWSLRLLALHGESVSGPMGTESHRRVGEGPGEVRGWRWGWQVESRSPLPPHFPLGALWDTCPTLAKVPGVLTLQLLSVTAARRERGSQHPGLTHRAGPAHPAGPGAPWGKGSS